MKEKLGMTHKDRLSTGRHRTVGATGPHRTKTMELPIFPLKNIVLFPGMVLPLHIFEPRYREMINRCIDEKIPFGVVLIAEGEEVGEAATPHMIGTAAKIVRVERLPDGQMNITALGTERFEIMALHQQHSYLTATVKILRTVNGSTQQAIEMAQRIRSRLVEYIDLLSKVNDTELSLDRLPEDPMSLAFLVAIALQVPAEDKQTTLALQSIPSMLAHEYNLLSQELVVLQYMADTLAEAQEMNGGLTGYIFPN